jgi:spore photoproduct lyase
MIIYYEKDIAKHPRAQDILEQFSGAEKVEIDHYKNLFDKQSQGWKMAPALILAKSPIIPILQVPANYGYTPHSFFFKASINCVYDCQYCYLK